MKRDVWLVDPMGGGIEQVGNMLVVRPRKIRIVGNVEVSKERFDPGLIYCTETSLASLTDAGVVKALVPHLLGNWANEDADDRRANDEAADVGGVIYNLNGDVWIITHPGEHTAVIMRWEY